MINQDLWKEWNRDKIRNFLTSEREGIESRSRKKIREILSEFPGASLLDVACGPAIELDGYKKYGLNINCTGMDFAENMIDVAKSKHPGETFLLGDINAIPFDGDSFDIVLARHIFEHLPHYRKPLAECIRVARKMVIVNFFIQLNDTQNDEITTRGGNIYNNSYSRKKFENFIKGLRIKKVDNFTRLGASCFSENEIYVLYKENSLK